MERIFIQPEAGHKLTTTESTNDDIQKLPPGSWVTAKEQKNGRGRRNRTWLDFAVEKIIFSCKISISPDDCKITLLSPTSALAVKSALIDIFPELTGTLQLKWPNDLYIQGKKFCGILIEPEITGDSLTLVIGIGINLFANEIPIELATNATAIFTKPTGKADEIVMNMIQKLNYYINELVTKENPDILYKELNAESFLNGKTIQFSHNDKVLVGEVLEINSEGFLVIDTGSHIIELTDTTDDMRIL